MNRRRIMMSRAGATPVLPAEYQEVEYVGSTLSGNNGSYIQTSIIVNGNTRVKLRLATTGSQSPTNYFGINADSSGATRAFGIISFSSTQKLGFFIFGGSVPAIPFDNAFHSYELSSSGCKIDGVTYPLSGTISPITMTKPLLLFSFRSANTTSFSPQKLGRVEITGDTSALFVPCYRKADDEIGMYETVSQTFYTNSGIGTFVKGADV